MAPVDYEIQTAGRFWVLPAGYPPPRWDITEEQLKNLGITRARINEDAAKILSQRYQIGNWLAVCQLAPVSLAEWLGVSEDPFIQRYGFPMLVMEAVKHEVEILNRKIRQRQAEHEAKLKEAVHNPTLSALGGRHADPVSKVFNKH